MEQDYLKTGYWRECLDLRGRRRSFMICIPRKVFIGMMKSEQRH